MSLASKEILNWAFINLYMKKITLEVFADNLIAIDFYKTLGFRVAESSFASKSTDEDGIVRWKKDSGLTKSEISLSSNRRLLYNMSLNRSEFYDKL